MVVNEWDILDEGREGKGEVDSRSSVSTIRKLQATIMWQHYCCYCYCIVSLTLAILSIYLKVKVGFLYSAAYAIIGPARFTISEVAVDWQEPMVLQRKLRPSNCTR